MNAITPTCHISGKYLQIYIIVISTNICQVYILFMNSYRYSLPESKLKRTKKLKLKLNSRQL